MADGHFHQTANRLSICFDLAARPMAMSVSSSQQASCSSLRNRSWTPRQ